MIRVTEAEDRIRHEILALTSQKSCRVPLSDALHSILHTELKADRPYPPYDRVAMDGIALAHDAWAAGRREFRVAQIARAGDAQIRLEDEKACVEVMTGGVLPLGCDSIVPYEVFKMEDGIAKLESPVELGQNVHHQGSDVAMGDVMIAAGTELKAAHIGIAASVGAAQLTVRAQARIAIVSTGDELVAVDAPVLPHQIRGSNGPGLRALLSTHGFSDATLFHLNDREFEKSNPLGEILAKHDVLILSGGVSAGKFDYVPAALKDLRVREVFHKIQQRPGKPMWFGVGPERQLVFGLPGNPVSVLVCARRYVLNALRNLRGQAPERAMRAQLAADLSLKKALTLFVPVRVEYSENGVLVAHPLKQNGSGDFASLGASDGLVELSNERSAYAKGDLVPLFLWNGA